MSNDEDVRNERLIQLLDEIDVLHRDGSQQRAVAFIAKATHIALEDVAQNHAIPYRLCQILFQIMESPGDEEVTALEMLTRLVSTSWQGKEKLVTPANVDAILLQMSRHPSGSPRVQYILVLTRLNEAQPTAFAELALKFFQPRLSSKSEIDVDVAVSAAEAVFPIIPKTAADLFLTEGLLETLVEIAKSPEKTTLRQPIVQLWSAACIDKKCRQAIDEKCLPFLEDRMLCSNPEPTVALVVAKLGSALGMRDRTGGVTLESTAYTVLRDSCLSASMGILQVGVEGLAYLSTKSTVKENVAKDKHLLEVLLRHIRESNGALLFGAASIISNVVSYLPPKTEDDKRVAELRAYAKQSRSAPTDALDDSAHVDERCRFLIEAGVVPAIIPASKSRSPTVVQLVSGIMFAITNVPKHRGILAQQGLLDVLQRYASLAEPDNAVLAIVQQQSSLSLARLVVSNNPTLLFQSRPLDRVVKPLASLLKAPESEASPFISSGGRDLEPVFDALRAFTNIASIGEGSRKIITEQVFSLIVSQLWSGNKAVLQAAVECVLNLTQSFSAVQRLLGISVDTSKDYTSSDSHNTKNNNLHLLNALAQSQTPGIRRAAAATLAHVLAWDIGVKAFMKLDQGVENLLGCVKEAVLGGDQELLVRAVMASWLLLTTSREDAEDSDTTKSQSTNTTNFGPQVVKKLQDAQGLQLFRMLKQAGIGKDDDIGSMIDSILDTLQR